MINKKAKIGVEFAHLSIVVNVIAIAVILFLIFRKKETKNGESGEQVGNKEETKR